VHSAGSAQLPLAVHWASPYLHGSPFNNERKFAKKTMSAI